MRRLWRSLDDAGRRDLANALYERVTITSQGIVEVELTQLRNLVRSHHAVLARAGIVRQPFHQLRHACATLLLGSGEELANISKLLGHSSLATTADFYGHLTPGISRRASERMGAILAG